MRRITFSLLFATFCACIPLTSNAQEYYNKRLRFVYIDHETKTPINRLCEHIIKQRDNAIEFGDALILYLANGLRSQVALVNLEDKSGQNRNKPESFFNIIDALQNTISHSVNAREDRRNILNLFDEYNFINENKEFLFKSVTMDFYVDEDFWGLRHNERIIAHLYTIFEAVSYPPEQFIFNVYKPRENDIHYPEGKPFGQLNIDNINKTLRILTY